MNKYNILIGILVICGMVLIGYPLASKFGLLESIDTSKPDLFSDDLQIDKILNNDWEVLESENPAEHHVYGALTRLAKMKTNPATLKLVLNYYDNDSERIREGVAAALGNYEDEEVDDKLVDMLKDKSEQVRIQAIKSLGETKNLNRVMILGELYTNSEKLSEGEKLALTVTLLKASPDLKIKNQMIDSLSKYATADNELTAEAAQSLIQFAPRSDKTRKLFEKIIVARKPVVSAQRGIIYLSSAKSDVLKKSLSQLTLDKNDEIRAAAIQGLAMVCPDNRYFLVKRAIRGETSSAVASIIAATVLRIFDDEMRSTIKSLDGSSVGEKGKEALDRIERGIAENKFNNTCR